VGSRVDHRLRWEAVEDVGGSV
jgi:hypothetical protein